MKQKKNKTNQVVTWPSIALEDDLKNIEKESKYEKEEIKEADSVQNKLYRKDYIERKLLGIAFWKKDSKILEKLPEAANLINLVLSVSCSGVTMIPQCRTGAG